MIVKDLKNCMSSRLFSVITGFIPVILVQRMTNQVNKFALLFKRSLLSQDCRNRLCVMSGNDGCRGCLSMFFPFIKLLNRMYHSGSSANELTLKAKDDNKSVLQLGRSMIEMLGVLAIIAVLSVGGIAGYSKAMQAHKSNIQRQLLSELLQAMIEIKPKLGTNLAEFQNITDLVYSLGYLPEGTTYKNSTIYDKSGNMIQIHKYNRDDAKHFVLEIFFRADQDSDLSRESEEFCHNIVWAAKPIAQDIKVIDYYRIEDGKGTVYSLFSTKSLISATLNDIQSKCHFMAKDGGGVHYSIHLWP